MTSGGEIFMLEMGDGIRIVDIARRMIRLRGLRPDLDVEVAFSGVRPGEKLREELLRPDERPQPTRHPLIHAIRGVEVPAWEETLRSVTLLGRLAERGDRRALVRELARVARGAPARRAGDVSVLPSVAAKARGGGLGDERWGGQGGPRVLRGPVEA